MNDRVKETIEAI